MSETVGLPRLQGERVVIRAPLSGELDTLAEAIASDPQASIWWSTSAATIKDDWFSEPDYYVLVVEQSAQPIGIVAFGEVTTPEYRSAGIDIALVSTSVGVGLGSETMRLLARWLFEERGHHRLTIDPALANERAVHVYEKIGFKPIGVAREYERGSDGRWHDNLLMDMLEADFRRASAEL
jgi:aminoglycoside 6'-N-acetyltransferase